MWRNIFNYSGTATQKEYWLALITNVIAMYVFVIPYALITILLTNNTTLAITIYLIAIHLPVLSLYFRRANDANWKPSTALLMALACPIVSGFIVGMFPSIPNGTVFPRFYSAICKLFAVSLGLFLYGGFLGILIFGDPTALPFLSISGLLLGAGTLIFGGIIALLK